MILFKSMILVNSCFIVNLEYVVLLVFVEVRSISDCFVYLSSWYGSLLFSCIWIS